MRRANGTGGITKMSGNRRKPWRARITVGSDEDGNQLYKNIGYFATKAEAEIAIALDTVMPASENANIKLKELFEQWKKTRAYTELSKQTQDNYDAVFKNYMNDFHRTKFSDLRTQHFQNMVDKADMLKKSRSTMEKIKALSVILSKFAHSQDIVLKTYAQGVRLPKIEKKKIDTFTELERKKLFDNESMPLVDSVLILIYTGMRIEELLSLTRFNIDIANMVITGGMKTEAGTDRIIPIHTKIQKYVRTRYNTGFNYLIATENGKKWNQSNYRKKYYELLDNLGIRRLTPHKARHTFFTLMDEKCKDDVAMALIGGHSDPAFSKKTYVQPDIERLKRAIESI